MTDGPGRLPPESAAAHVVVADLATLELADDAHHHLARVLRLRPGDVVTATDGDGRWRSCRFDGGADLEPDGEVVVVLAPAPPITIAFALTKGAKPELTVQKLVELGVDRITPFRAARSVVRWDDDKARGHHRRWCDIARGAVEQSRACRIPVIDHVLEVGDVVALGAARLDRGGRPPTLSLPVLAVGPEGGWDDDERAMMPDAVGLGQATLRAETAALTAGGVLTALRSGFVAEVS